MKKYLIVLTSIFVFLLCSGEVKAKEINQTNFIDDDCANKGTCMAVCNYTRFEKQKMYAYEQLKDYKLKTTLYYSFKDKKYFMKYQSLNRSSSGFNIQTFTIDANTFNKYTKNQKVLSHKDKNGNPVYKEKSKIIHWLSDNDNISTDNLTCPKYSYYDDTLTKEWCFDNDQKYCKTKENLGTSFKKVSTNDYNYETYINTYIDEAFKKYETDIKNGTLNPKTDGPELIERDFNKNYLHGIGGEDIPGFILNSTAYKRLKTDIVASIKKSCEELLKEADTKLKNGSMTQEQYDNLKNSCTITAEEEAKMKEEYGKAIEDIGKFEQTDIPDSWKDFESENCDSILGSVEKTDNPEPAYYMNFVFKLMKYIAIVLLFILSVIEFARAIPSNDNEAIKKTVIKTIKRIILCIIIYFLPTVINFVLETFGIIDDPTCGIGV